MYGSAFLSQTVLFASLAEVSYFAPFLRIIDSQGHSRSRENSQPLSPRKLKLQLLGLPSYFDLKCGLPGDDSIRQERKYQRNQSEIRRETKTAKETRIYTWRMIPNLFFDFGVNLKAEYCIRNYTDEKTLQVRFALIDPAIPILKA